MPTVFDPKVVGRIERLDLKARRLVEGFMLGIHRSPYRGVSTDFAEHRHYVQGDDTRHIDWKIYARSDRYYVKKYEQETNMEVRFLLDCSKSMFFRGAEDRPTKFEYGATLVASLAYLLMGQHDSFGLLLFDREVKSALPPRSTYAHFKVMTDMLEKAAPGADTGLGNVIKKMGAQIRRRGMLVLVSDFVDEMKPLAEGLGLLHGKGCDVILFHVEDPWERDFPFSGQTIFRGVEGEGKLNCDPRDLRGHYLKERKRHLDELYGACRQHGYFLEETPTSEPLDNILWSFLNLREATKRR